MKKVLYITANPKKEKDSYSLRAGKYYLDKLKSKQNVTVTELDVYKTSIPLIDADVLSAWGQLKNGSAFNELSESQQEKISQMNTNLNQFKEADEYIIVTPVWNFSLPPMLKAYIDNIMIAGETFKYTAAGVVGLMENKKVTIIQASGSVLSKAPLLDFNFANRYLEKVFQFMGIYSISNFTVEGVAIPGISEENRLLTVYKEIDEFFEK